MIIETLGPFAVKITLVDLGLEASDPTTEIRVDFLWVGIFIVYAHGQVLHELATGVASAGLGRLHPVIHVVLFPGAGGAMTLQFVQAHFLAVFFAGGLVDKTPGPGFGQQGPTRVPNAEGSGLPQHRGVWENRGVHR